MHHIEGDLMHTLLPDAKENSRLLDVGARLIRQAPHCVVRPKEAGGALVQLTPRVAY